ncbi:1-phosphofructokinase family hexose kinase [Segetibacter sp. 3557_3]|uniref:1-phosphofructokinase family hexose kinase n=1 Tax=Segetibacter sp. 3557_3 TaxID=2547429 RepID=UPI0010584B9E|nr:1-phosphofructokinase family hexose kinase [Segetibacter sp. 3557_3]TDH26065.1 1-phosphofructokinase family hexose kinase [Segetibacter sp. 3557_3]
MEKIVTLTLNPAIDKSTTVKAIVPDKKLRCADPVFEPGGGGVNVSRAIRKLGGTSTAVYLAGGYSGKHYEHLLHEEGLNSNVVEISGHTRENLIVMDESSNLQYRFGMPGPRIKEHEWQKCLQILEEAQGVEYIVASGSLPEGVPVDIFAKLAAITRRKNARLILDTSGEPLKQAMDDGVFMIKPNLGELSALHGVEELHREDAIEAAQQIIRQGGCEVMVISMGPSGAMLITRDNVYQSPSPTVKRKSTVGAGDTMVAGMVLSLTRGWEWGDVLKYGIAAGTATTLNAGTELCKLADVEKLYKHLKSVKVDAHFA